MTPMRKTFVTLVRLLSSDMPERHLERCKELFVALFTLARDPEEAGAAALFVSSALIFLLDAPLGSPATKAKLEQDLSNQGQLLAAVMLLRQGQVKGAHFKGDPLPFTDVETRFLNSASDNGVLVHKSREDPMIAKLSARGLLQGEADSNPDYTLMSLTAAGHMALAPKRRAS